MKVIRETELRNMLLLIVIFVYGGIGHLRATCSRLIELPVLRHLASVKLLLVNVILQWFCVYNMFPYPPTLRPVKILLFHI